MSKKSELAKLIAEQRAETRESSARRCTDDDEPEEIDSEKEEEEIEEVKIGERFVLDEEEY
jgi:hypothetical protein